MDLKLLICVLTLISQTSATKLNYPRVLLPIFDKISINFTLEVIEKGCFKWTSSRTDLIRLTPEYDEHSDRCTSKAVVSVITKEKYRNTAIVLAENLASGEVIRCDVIVDIIDQLEVLTTTRELYLEEAPETFELYAQDSQGNAFTTLKGIEFNWQISTQNNYQNNNENWKQVLRFLKFSESKYHEVPKTVQEIESMGLKGYMVLLEGINTGSATVNVRVPYPEYEHVRTVEVNIMVLANIILDPSEVNILVGDNINFRVLQLKQGKLQEISLNSQYFLEIEDPGIAEVRGNTATGLKLGKSVVKLRDRNYVPSDTDTAASLSPRSTITVAKAIKMQLSLLPHNNWITVEGERHDIAIDLYTRDNQKITLGPKYKVNSEFDSNLFFELSRTINGSRIYGEAIQAGRNPVQGNFENLNAENDMLIYKKLDLTPTLVVLPYDPNFPIRHQIKFDATGGDGSYTWTSLNNQLVTISQTGLAETKTENLKKQTNIEFANLDESLAKFGQVKVALLRNSIISKTADILFLTPVKLEIVHYNFETPLKDYVKIHVALYAYYNEQLTPFTFCNNLNFDLEFSTHIFIEDTNKIGEELPDGDACKIFYLKATNLGTTNLKVSYKFNSKILKDEVNLVVFEKLNIFNPVSNEIVLPIGASRNVIYKNGPSKVYSIEAELNKKTNFDKKLIDVTEYINDYTKEKHVFTILCKKVGETKFRFELYNSMNAKNHFPYISYHITTVYCVKPRFINLYTTARIKDGCPLQRRNSLMHVNNQQNEVEIEIEVLDEAKRKLSNITSLSLDWKFFYGDKLKGNTLPNRRVAEEELVESIPIPKRDYLKATLTDININFQIKGIVVDYENDVLGKYGIKPESPQFGIQKVINGPFITPIIENELNFLAVDNTLLPFDTMSVYLSKQKIERVKILQGSGHYEINLSEPGIITAEFDYNTRELIITPIRIGDVRIDILDRCLMTEPSHLYVSIVSIGKIEVQMPDRVEKTKYIEAVVKLFDSNDRPLIIEMNNLDIYELSEDIYNANLVSVKLGNQLNLNPGEVRVIVTGVELGETKIVFNAGRVDKQVSSEAVPIQVFPPLRLYPRNATLLIGSSVQIYSTGGPYPDVNIIYSVQSNDIAKMESSIVTGVKLGETIIDGRCVGINPATGNQIIYSEDSITLRVIPFDRIKVKVPLVRLKVGAIMPASVWAVPEISPMILGTLNSLKFHWSTNQPDVVELSGVFADAGIEYGEEDSITIRVKGLNPGKAQIQATVTTASGVKFQSTVEVAVFKMLELESPKKIVSDTILIAPKTNIQLKSNLEDTVYEIENGDQSLSVVKVARNGYVHSTESIGRSLVIATSADQTLPIPIEVRNIHYILVSLHPENLKLNSIESKIPNGFNLLLRISLHDNLGNEFSHNLDANALNFKLSRKEMVDVNLGDNFTVSLNLIRETSNMIAIALRDSAGIKYNKDFLKLSVGASQYIFPSKLLFSVGDIICFDSHVDSSSKWYSADESILSINEESGVGLVTASRLKHGDKVSVYQGGRNSGSLKFDLEVREADKIEFVKSHDIMNGEKYRAHLVVKNHVQIEKLTNVFSRNNSICLSKLASVNINFFSCKMISRQSDNNHLTQYFKAVPIFDKMHGSYGCDVTLLISMNELTGMVKSSEINFDLEAKLINGVIDTISIKIIPGILVTPTYMTVDQFKTNGITINGMDKILQKITIKTSDSSLLELVQLGKSSQTISYRVKLLKQFPENGEHFVEIYSPMTEQRVTIPILTSSSRLECATGPGKSVFIDFSDFISKFGLIISCIFVTIVTIAFIIYWITKSQPTDTSVFLSPQRNMTSPVQPPYSPNNMTISYDNDYSRAYKPQGDSSPIYGDTTLLSPQRRINRRDL